MEYRKINTRKVSGDLNEVSNEGAILEIYCLDTS